MDWELMGLSESYAEPAADGSGMSDVVKVGGAARTAAGTAPVSYLIGMILLLFVLKFLGDSDALEAIQPAHLDIGGYNVLTVTVVAVVGIASLKLILNRWQVRGLTDLINFI